VIQTLPPSPKGFLPLSPTASSLGRTGQNHVRQGNRRRSGARGEVRWSEGVSAPPRYRASYWVSDEVSEDQVIGVALTIYMD